MKALFIHLWVAVTFMLLGCQSPQTGEENHKSSYKLKQVDDHTWVSNLPPYELFSLLSRHISKKYEILSLNKKSLTLSTNWDKFVIKGRLFRNKLNITLFPYDRNYTEIVIKNEVEYHSEVKYSAAKSYDVWLPTTDITSELKELFILTKKAVNDL
jgi:hypothetical protein